MGLDETDVPARDPVAEMEKFGREYRMMMEGLMQLLRKRAEEKGNARVAQTVVGASEVNPLKFLPTVDDALATILAERSPGFLAGERGDRGCGTRSCPASCPGLARHPGSAAADDRPFRPGSARGGVEIELDDRNAACRRARRQAVGALPGNAIAKSP